MIVTRQKRRWSALEAARNVGVAAWRNRYLLKQAFNTWKSFRRSPANRPGDAPGARGRSYSRGGSGTSKFKRAFNKMDAFRSVPAINPTHLDLHSSMSFVLKAGGADEESYHHFIRPLEISHIEPYSLPSFEINDLLSARSLASPADTGARGYPCNQLLGYYNNFVVKNVEMKVDVRLVERVPGGAAAAVGAWLQTGQVTIPVNIALVRVSSSELEYLVNELPKLLKGGTAANANSFDGEQLSNYDRVLREQFGVVPLNMGAHRKEGVVSTKWSAAVADSAKGSDIVAGVGDHYTGAPDNKHIGVTAPPPNATTVVRVPEDAHFLVVLGWLNPTSLGEYLTGRPNERELEVVMDMHLRQYITLGDMVETAAGISSGTDIISRVAPVVEPLQPPGLKRSRV